MLHNDRMFPERQTLPMPQGLIRLEDIRVGGEVPWNGLRVEDDAVPRCRGSEGSVNRNTRPTEPKRIIRAFLTGPSITVPDQSVSGSLEGERGLTRCSDYGRAVTRDA